MNKLHVACTLAISLALCVPSVFGDAFLQTNLVSDISGMASVTDPNLKDPWGVSFAATSPIWVSDRAAGVSTLYNAQGVPQGGPLIVTIPPGAPLGPTGQVSAAGTNFRLNGSPVNFMFATLGGTIAAWNGGAGTLAVTMATTPGASYTGLALANNTLYAANFTTGGGINAFDSTFTPTTLSGHFVDPNAIAGFAPFNVQNIGGTLYVEYAKVTPGVPVALPGGGGYVDQFDTNGNFIRRLATNGPLDGPWGVAVTPSGFGSFAAGDVLVGNFGNGEINVFTSSGTFLQTVTDSHGNPLVNDGLWSLTFDPLAPGGASDPNALYFTAGLNMGNDGLFGKLDPVPEPGSWGLAALALLGLGTLQVKRRTRARQ